MCRDLGKSCAAVSDSANSPAHGQIVPAAPPYVDCIQWVPRRFSGGDAPVTVVDLVFSQQVFAEIHAQIASAPASPVFGAIVGTVFEDPTCARRWARLERVIACGSRLDEDTDSDGLAEALARTRAAVGESTLIGWYRTHHQAGLYLSPAEADFLERELPEEWGFGLILAGTGERLAGGVFQRTDPEGLSRSVYTPFYELAAQDSRPGSNARRTLLTWSTYQTDARIVRPGETDAAVTVATIPELGDRVTPTPVPERPAGDEEVEEDVGSILDQVESIPVPPERSKGAADGPPPRPVTTDAPPPRAAETAPPSDTNDVDEEWEKIQIQRSLSAVGRSLGPSTIGTLGAPAPVSTEDEDERSEAVESESTPPDASPQGPEAARERSGRPPLTVIAGRDPETPEDKTSPPDESVHAGRESGIVIPIGGTSEPTPLVGRSRRRSRLPVARISGVAAGVLVLLGAGWIGTRVLADRGAEGDGGSAVAGLSLSPTDLFGQREDPANTPPDPGAIPVEEDGEETTPGLESGAVGEDDEGPEAAGGEEAAIQALDPLNVSIDAEADDGSEGSGAREIPTPLPPEIVQAPSLDSFRVQDPAISAFENALSIFRAEIDRYDELRKEFDEGLTSCNPLNLAYRGVRDGHSRLERRYLDVANRIDIPTSRTYQAAVRQFAVARTHFELTDCPMPIGG